MTIIERILCKLFNHIDITDGGEVYLRRWFISPRNPKDSKQWSRLYLHKFCKSDNLRDLHDHPWPYRTFILTGGYWEHSFNPEYRKSEHIEPFIKSAFNKTRKKWYGPFSSFKRGAKWTHAVELKDERPAWTLFMTGPKERSWGFHTDKGWCWHNHYHNGVCWCYDGPPSKDVPVPARP